MRTHQLSKWAQFSTHNLKFYFVTVNEYKETEDLLLSRFAIAETVYGTEQLHAFMLVKKGILNTKMHFASPNYTENHLINVLQDISEMRNITGFVMCMHYNLWW
jgi:hypothetical protein